MTLLMEELPDRWLNRGALTVIPKKQFWDWVNYTTPDLPVDFSTHNDYNTYLIRNEIDPTDLEQEMKKHFPIIFENELNGWWTDETEWPQNRSWELFNQWFEVKYSPLIFDLAEAPPLKLD